MITIDFNYTVYNKHTGKYVKNLAMPDIESAKLNVTKDEVLVEGSFGENTKYENGVIKKFILEPEKPRSIRKAVFIGNAAKLGLLPVQSIGLAATSELPSFISLDHFNKEDEIDMRVWWATSNELFFHSEEMTKIQSQIADNIWEQLVRQ